MSPFALADYYVQTLYLFKNIGQDTIGYFTIVMNKTKVRL